MKRIITLLAVCLLGFGQAFAQDDVFLSEENLSSDDYFKNHPDRSWSSEIKLTIRTSDYFEFRSFPEYKVRLDYFLCEALTHKVLSIETRTVSVAANDFTDHIVLLKAPAGQVIRDDIHYDFQTKYNGKFKTRFGGYNSRHTFVPMYWKNRELFVSQSEVERFYFDFIPGETYKQLNDPTLPTKTIFYLDDDSNVWVNPRYDRNEMVKKFMGHFPASESSLQAPSMKDGFWPTKISGAQLRHTITFALKYNDEKTPVPSDLKLYLFIESPIYNRNGQLLRIANYDSGESVFLELSSTSRKPRIQGTFPMDNNERLFPYPVWVVVAQDLRTGKYTAVDWGLLDMHAMFSEDIYAFNVIGTIKNGDIVQSVRNGDLKVDRGK